MDADTKETLAQIYRAAVAAVDPYASVMENLRLEPGVLVMGGARYPLTDINDIYVIAAGKAAYGMARAAQDVLGELVTAGVAVTKDGHGGPLARMETFEASHPVPDERGLVAAARIMELAAGAGESDLVICLLSGGASSLMVLPAHGITLQDKQAVTRLLLSSGSDIAEINCVRKHLSAVKGGRLAEAAYPAPVASLIISDVIGNDPGVIASGPTAPDETTFSQAMDILQMRGVYERVPDSVRTHLKRGVAGLVDESPKPGSHVFERVNNLVVASNTAALRKAKEVAGYLGYHAAIIDPAVSGEARDAGRAIAEAAIRYRREGGNTPACLIFGGETTVTIRGNGLGGRAQETALSFARAADGVRGVSALFAGTDGTDGPTDAAGAFADGATVADASDMGLGAGEYLSGNDSYHFFKATGGLFIPGPTGTNVMDIGIVLVR